MFFAGVFLFSSRDHLEKKKNENIPLNMVLALRVTRIKGDLRIPVLGHYSKIKYMYSVK